MTPFDEEEAPPPRRRFSPEGEKILRMFGEIHANSVTCVRLLADIHSVVVHGRAPVKAAVPVNTEATKPVNPITWDAVVKLIDPLGALLGGIGGRKRK